MASSFRLLAALRASVLGLAAGVRGQGRRVTLLGWVAAALVCATATSSAQTASGQITGSVKDASGSVIAKVKVTVTNQDTGLTRGTTTNDEGDYVVPLLPVGRYLVTAEQAGFKIAVRSDVRLTVDQIQRVDLDLEAGSVSETVEVKAAAVTLDTGSASIGQTITARQVTELPLNGRNFIQLLFLGAGAVEVGGEQGGMRQGVGNAISIMGSRPTSNNFMIDGTANVDTALGTPAAILSVDAIEEFKEQTTTYSAEYGFSANQINLVSKSGTNVFHGTGFGFMRNEAFDARNFFDPGGAEKPQLDQKQFGGVIGGPVWHEPDLLPLQLRRDAHQARLQLVLHRAQPREPRRPLLDHDHRSAHRPAVPEQHHSAVAFLAARAAGSAQQLVSGAQQHRGAGQLSAGPHAAAGSGPVHDSRRSHARPVWSDLRPLHQHLVRQPHQRQLARDRRSRVRAGHEELAGIAHVGGEVEPRESVPRRPGRGTRRSERHRLPAGRRRLPAADRRVHRPA